MRKFLIGIFLLGIISGSLPVQAAVFPRGPEFVGPLLVPQSQAEPQAIEQSKTETPAVTPELVKVPKVAQQEKVAPQEVVVTNKQIIVSLADQDLKYFEGTTLVGEFKISSGLKNTPTPPGSYTVLVKKPVVDYKGANYDFKNTKWNLLFKKNTPLNYYIHGAYWHHNFGKPASHGCINVAYDNMEGLYNWADVGTKITIQ